MKLLWDSNAPWAGTGYGSQTKLILPALRELGHEPECFAFWGLQGGRLEYDGYPVWPGSPFDAFGSDVIRAHLKNSKVDVLVTLMDLFVLDETIWGNLPVPWVAWVPIDCEDIGFPTLNLLKLVDVKVAMSEFGAREMEKAGLPADAVIYHAVDTETFTIPEPEEKDELRKRLGVDPDCYLIGMVMANKGDRKQYPVQLQAIREWMDRHESENIKVLIHSEPSDKMGGWDLKTLVGKYGLSGKVHSIDSYFTTICPIEGYQMAEFYKIMDVLLNCSAGEGFGIPIVEAQACGVPVIVTAATAMPELVFNGYAVPPIHSFLGGHYGTQFIPSREGIVEALEANYRMADKSRAVHGRECVVDRCSLPVVAQQWSEVLETLLEPAIVESPYLEHEMLTIDDQVLDQIGYEDGPAEVPPEVVPS